MFIYKKSPQGDFSYVEGLVLKSLSILLQVFTIY